MISTHGAAVSSDSDVVEDDDRDEIGIGRFYTPLDSANDPVAKSSSSQSNKRKSPSVPKMQVLLIFRSDKGMVDQTDDNSLITSALWQSSSSVCKVRKLSSK